eukprot:11185652-Lingulodinium_polyedra.AAC.1
MVAGCPQHGVKVLACFGAGAAVAGRLARRGALRAALLRVHPRAASRALCCPSLPLWQWTSLDWPAGTSTS